MSLTVLRSPRRQPQKCGSHPPAKPDAHPDCRRSSPRQATWMSPRTPQQCLQSHQAPENKSLPRTTNGQSFFVHHEHAFWSRPRSGRFSKRSTQFKIVGLRWKTAPNGLPLKSEVAKGMLQNRAAASALSHSEPDQSMSGRHTGRTGPRKPNGCGVIPCSRGLKPQPLCHVAHIYGHAPKVNASCNDMHDHRKYGTLPHHQLQPQRQDVWNHVTRFCSCLQVLPLSFKSVLFSLRGRHEVLCFGSPTQFAPFPLASGTWALIHTMDSPQRRQTLLSAVGPTQSIQEAVSARGYVSASMFAFSITLSEALEKLIQDILLNVESLGSSQGVTAQNVFISPHDSAFRHAWHELVHSVTEPAPTHSG